jgi:hypothetical protein
LWFAAGWRAIWQATTGKRAWAKTTRTADGNAAAEDARLAAMAREAVQTLDVRITAQPLETDHKPTSIDRAGDDRPVDWEIAVPDTWDSIEQRDGLVIYRDPERHMIQRRPARPGRGADPLVVFSSPERDGSVAVRRVSSPYPLTEGPLRAEAAYRGCDYRRLRLGETTFKRRPAMAWQFIYREGGTLIHADELHLMARGNRYVVSLWSPEASWERMRDVLEPIRDSFDLFDG